MIAGIPCSEMRYTTFVRYLVSRVEHEVEVERRSCHAFCSRKKAPLPNRVLCAQLYRGSACLQLTTSGLAGTMHVVLHSTSSDVYLTTSGIGRQILVQDLGALGEFLGFIAVLGTLLFLAYQLRRSARLTKVSVLQSLRSSAEGRLHLMLQGKDVMGAFLKAINDEKLSQEEEVICREYFGSIAQSTEHHYLLFRSGVLDESTFIPRFEFLMASLQSSWSTLTGKFKSGAMKKPSNIKIKLFIRLRLRHSDVQAPGCLICC